MDWESEKTELLLNPRMPAQERERLAHLVKNAPHLPGHVWLATSGSTGSIKMAALSRTALLISAQSINNFLGCTSEDIWINPLPNYHVGGLGIEARAHLSKSRVIEVQHPQGKWDYNLFHKSLHLHFPTLASLVPAQLFDLIAQHLKPPSSLRAVIVGGGSLNESLYHQAVALGWKVLPSYGLTECSSQVATASPCFSSQELHLLPHVEVKCNSQGCLQIKSPSLLTLYAFDTPDGPLYIDPKENQWFTTEDLGEIDFPYVRIVGRQTNFIKIGGESVDVNRLEKIFEEIRIGSNYADAAIIPVPDSRLGFVIALAISSKHSSEAQLLMQDFNNKVLPFEKIRVIHMIERIPRSPLSKIRKTELLNELMSFYDRA